MSFISSYLIGLLFTGLALTIPAKSVADELPSRPMNSANDATQVKASSNHAQQDQTGRANYAAVDYCHKGSAVNPVTGEIVDLFVLCTEDGAEQNMDLA